MPHATGGHRSSTTVNGVIDKLVEVSSETGLVCPEALPQAFAETTLRLETRSHAGKPVDEGIEGRRARKV